MIYIRFLKYFFISIFTFQTKLKFAICPFCVKKRIFLGLGREPYQTRCLSCKGTLVSLSAIKTITDNNLIMDSTYELSFHGVLFEYLKKNSKKFTFSEYFPVNKSRYVNGIRNEDVQRLTFNSESFDLITSTEVFEHVPNYLKGFKEIYRVLKKDGFFCFTVPIFEISKQICKLHQDGSLLWLAPEEYHGSRLTGDNSVPVFWHHSGEQILKDLIATGFKEAKAINHFWFDKTNQIVFVAKK
ncbi:class I SAM-dependent methyltransferase [Candidatus Methylopumilus universalis]|nr:class I SAM-dependent methyltransferase [Candidatus Methylopumilus universalis]QDC81658.1 class I SAM-dependent methyltransferase [Candidatus Methylopumilus universalis]QDC88096.1 class I SAM-dependent methyltransferase [Candidatus Methylopumilus universalis]